MKLRLMILSAVLLFSGAKIYGETVNFKDQEIWYDTTGNKENQPLLLIMGGGCQGILWPKEFCNQLANAGFYVIRFDHRDTGLSTYYDFMKTPYTLLDMATDGKKVLDHLKIDKAHICGASMGGGVAQLFGAHYPERTRSLILMSTTAEFGNIIDCLERKAPREPSLSSPSPIYLKWMSDSQSKELLTFEELINKRVEGWRILNGSKYPFEEELSRDLMIESFKRQRDQHKVLNHIFAIKYSVDLVREASRHIQAPTLIVHGNQDLIFFKDHMDLLKNRIPSAKVLLIDGMGHNLNGVLYSEVVKAIQNHAQGN